MLTISSLFCIWRKFNGHFDIVPDVHYSLLDCDNEWHQKCWIILVKKIEFYSLKNTNKVFFGKLAMFSVILTRDLIQWKNKWGMRK